MLNNVKGVLLSHLYTEVKFACFASLYSYEIHFLHCRSRKCVGGGGGKVVSDTFDETSTLFEAD